MDQAVPGNNQPGIVDAAWALGADLPCQRPVRMQRRDVATGVESTVCIRCGTRVASLCPSCASLYRGDVAAVLRDGLFGTAEDEVIVLLTLTAPSFGETHFVPPQAPPKDEKKAHAGWERRFGKRKCRCGNKHLPGDKEWTGVPRDSETYDYEGQVRWNRMVPRLWTRTADELTRVLLSDGSRLPYAAVTEFQRRGAVHLHVLMRVPTTFTLDLYEDEGAMRSKAIEQIVAKVGTYAPGDTSGHRFEWGGQAHAQVITDAMGRDKKRAAGYLAKLVTYAAKDLASDGLGSPIDEGPFAIHLDTLTRQAQKSKCSSHWASDEGSHDCVDCRRGQRSSAWGFRGHTLRRSRNWSTMSLTSCREARRAWQAKGGVDGSAEWFEPDTGWSWSRRKEWDRMRQSAANAMTLAPP